MLKLSDFDYELPDRLIAQIPAEKRDRSRLMVVDRKSGSINHDTFTNLGAFLSGHPLMVFNDTRVLPAKLTAYKKDGGKQVDILLVREEEPGVWEAMVKGLGKLKTGTEFVFGDGRLTGVFIDRREDRALLRLASTGNLNTVLEETARMPLPPYIRRESHNDTRLDALDRERYQTVYARNAGAIAAPTAGLHFTPAMLEELRAGLAETAFLTLHVGVGTFQPVRVEDIARHRMEKEYFHLPKETSKKISEARNEGRKILAVGTTTTRVLESMDLTNTAEGDVEGWTERFIYPGYGFNIVGGLLTNFHLPKSTLFMLVCAFGGMGLMKKAYREAVRKEYRFFSYGDAMLIL